MCCFERLMVKLFESSKNVTTLATGELEAKIVFYETPRLVSGP